MRNSPEQEFEFLAYQVDEPVPAEAKAPSSLKSRVYSALVRQQAASGPLLGLDECHAAGRGLCVFEQLVRIAPVGRQLKMKNPCDLCHARVLAETFDHPPIYWPNCPYVKFQKG